MGGTGEMGNGKEGQSLFPIFRKRGLSLCFRDPLPVPALAFGIKKFHSFKFKEFPGQDRFILF